MSNCIQASLPPISSIVTVNVLIDILDKVEVLHVPDNRKRKIAWFSPFFPDAHDVPPADDNIVCYLLTSGDFEEGLRTHPQALGLLILEPDEPEPSVDIETTSSLVKRLIVIRRKTGSPTRTEIIDHIGIALFNLYRWNERCEEIVRSSGNIQELIDISADLFGNWLDVSDATYSLVAYVRTMEPPDTLSKNLVELGCHNSSQLDEARDAGLFGEWRNQNGVQVFNETDDVPFKHATYVLKHERSYRGHVVMVCNNRLPTPGLLDLFESFSVACEKILVGTRTGTTARAPYEGFLMHMLDNPSPSQDYVENQKATIGIEEMGAFCVAVIDSSEGAYSEQPMFLLSQARESLINALVMSYDNALFALFYAPTLQSEIILTMAKRLEQFCERFDCLAFESTIFSAIENLSLAYQQARATKHYRYAIENGLVDSTADAPEGRSRVFFFADAFCCLVYDLENITDPLITYSLHNSQLDIIEQLQGENEVSDLKVLYYFLYNERKATPTAKQLGMHRNNVLYRISAIEKRYHFDLDDFSTRQYLLACYRMKINSSPQFRKQLL